MSKLIETINKLPEEQRHIFSKYMGVMQICEKQIDEKLHFAEINKIEITTLKGALRYLSMELDDIERIFATYKAAGFEDLIIHNPEYIRFVPETIIERISICQKVGKPFKVDGKYAPFLFDDNQWNAVEKVFADGEFEKTKLSDYREVNPDEWTTNQDIDDVIYKALSYNEPIDFDETTYDKYMKVSQILKGTKEALGANPVNDTMALPISEDDLITRLIKINPTLDEKTIAKYTLQYCYGIVDGIDPIIDAIAESFKEEKRGL